jgi:6-phosphogluconate dehydrogenase
MPSAALEVTPDKVGQADVGIVGMGVMGANLAINMLDRGFTVAIWNLAPEVCEKFVETHSKTYGATKILAAETYGDFAKLMKKPRKVLILVTAGKVTDIVIDNLMKVFEAEDIIVDTGNAHFKDQSTRAEMVEAKGMRFLGMGISGGAEGARKGPAFFPGGTLSIWEDIRPIVEAASAKASDGRPCVTMCGKGGAGSCVKMYHNAGEYAVLQIWAETFATLRGIGLDGAQIQETLKAWKARGDLDSYMLDITYEVAGKEDSEAPETLLVENTADMIGSKGTGLWSVQVAMDVGCPVPSLAQAVLARQMSMVRPERLANAERIQSVVEAPPVAIEDREKAVEDLYWTTYLSIVASYAQMFQALRAVDEEFQLEITGNLPRIISTFRAGCILQGAMLEPMTKAFEADPNMPNLICAFKEEIGKGMPGMRRTLSRLVLGGEPAGVMQASLGYLSTMSRPTLCSAQVVSLQRDVFGRHGFKKLRDGKATEESYNADWNELQ